ERAASNLSIELDQKPGADLRDQPAGWPRQRQHLPQTRSLAESRELLARELEAISTQSRNPRPDRPQMRDRSPKRPSKLSRPSITQAVGPTLPASRPPQKSSSWRSLA